MAKDYVRSSNLSALKDAWNKQTKKGDFKFWKPIKNGRYVVRFLPPKDSEGLFFKETAQHKLGESYYFCPKSEGDTCPICEYYKSLYDKGTDDAIALAKEIKPRKQYLYNVIIKEELDNPVADPTKTFVYMSGKILYETLMDYFFDDDYGDLTDVEHGYDFMIVKEQGDLGFPTYKKSKPKKNPTPLAADEASIEKILQNMRDLKGELEYKSYEELKNILKKFIDTEKSGADFFGSNNSTAASGKSSTKAAPVGAAPAPDTEEDADDLDEFQSQLLAEIENDKKE